LLVSFGDEDLAHEQRNDRDGAHTSTIARLPLVAA
jgi:hypothetical protein